MFKPDKIQLRAEIIKSEAAGAEYALVSILVNSCKMPFIFSVFDFLRALEYAGRYQIFHVPGRQNGIFTDVIINEENYWIWKNYFTSDSLMAWYFEREKALRQVKRLQSSLKKLCEGRNSLPIAGGGTVLDLLAYEYTRPKLIWTDYLDKALAKKLVVVRNNGWQTEEEDLKEIEYYLLEGAHIYKENRSGKRLLDKILDQPNAQLKELVCKIANYPLAEPDTNTIILIKDGKEKRFGAPKRMSLREAVERGFLVEIYE
ncbi:MAG: hypothetical protein Q4E34_00290 [Synergistaceae bacterium]|nr:hypothetical protein [Synergistaceae bacterium]